MKKIYTIATAHLDTCWLWDQKETIEKYLKPSFEENFRFADKYSSYRFNFEGSYRYELLEEYYPETFKKLKGYVDLGKFNVTGSSFENGDVNIVSPEALIRNILYGNTYFYNKFNKRSNDIYLPDCFGFGKALPSIARHCNLIGFSTQKLTWGSASGIPFELGKWEGLDHNYIYVSVDGGDYGTILKDVRNKYLDKIEKNAKNGIEATMVYHGTGDRGGSPFKKSIKELEKAIKANDNNIVTLSSTPSELFFDLEKFDLENKGKLPVMKDEYLLTFHGVGSYTARTQMKRFNKKCEALADICERANVLSYLLGYEYPSTRIDFAWKKILQHHFHDDITGTSFASCYKKSYNDYILALDYLEDEYINATNNIASLFDTSNTKGLPILVFNGSQDNESSICKIKIKGLNNKKCKVLNANGNEILSQVNNDILTIEDNFKGNTFSLYDVIYEPSKIASSLSFKDKVLENQRYILTFNEEYEIASIYDKKIKKELLASSIHFEFLKDTHSINYPSWEIEYEDIIKESYAKAKFKEMKVLEKGNAFISLQIIRTFNKSTFKEIITLANSSNRIDVYNEIDWQEEACDLKVRFDVNASNDKANYDIGISTYQRGTNNKNRYEVPAQKFADITNSDDSYGVSILTDSKTGWDFPNSNTLRLTAIHTPLGNYRYECSQHLLDFGLNRFTYSIFSHEGKCDKSIIEADNLNKGIQGFILNKHEGIIKDELSLVSINYPNIRILAIKKALESDDIILRVCEYKGEKTKGVKASFPYKIKKASLCFGDEQDISAINLNDDLIFDMEPFEIKSFKLTFDIIKKDIDEYYLDLPFNNIGITGNKDRASSTLINKISLAKEMILDDIYTNGTHYKIKKDEKINALVCEGQKIKIYNDYKYANILAINLGNDRNVIINNQEHFILSSLDTLGCWDLISLGKVGYIKDERPVYANTHFHQNKKDVIAHDIYFSNIKVQINDKQIILPNDPNLVIFAITLNNKEDNALIGMKTFDSLKKRDFNYVLSKNALKKASEPNYQKILDIFFNRRKTYKVIYHNSYTTQSLSDVYMLNEVKKNKKEANKVNKGE